MLLSRIVDQHVDPTEARDHLVHCLVAECLLADVALDEQHLSTLPFDHCSCLPGIGLLLFINDTELRPLAREEHADRTPDAGISTCDQGNLATKSSTAWITRLVVGRGPHLGFESWLSALRLRRLTCPW